jgi:uncharacterized protein YndB with AHSA1/START domain
MKKATTRKKNNMAINISTLKISASRQKIWGIVTKPEFVKLWQYGSDLLTTWEIGSNIKFRTEWEGKVFEQWGKVLVFKPTEIVKYSLFVPRPDLEDKPENYFIMSYVLTEENGHTKLEIIQEDNRPNAVQEEPQGEENPVLMLLKKLAETE